MNATLRDVAKVAGVSVATVSNVINKSLPVMPETEKKVLAAIAETQYVPNIAARRLKKGRSKIIGVISPGCDNAWFSSVLRAMETELMAAGYVIIIGSSSLSVSTEKELIDKFSSGIVDGLIIISMCTTAKKLNMELPGNIPCVVVDFHEAVKADRIVHSFQNAFEEMIPFLKENGHREIGLCLGVEHLSSVGEQMRIFKEQIEKNGLCYEKRFVINVSHMSDIQKKIKNVINDGCTALCFINGNMLTKAFYNTEINEFSIPEGLQVIYGKEAPDMISTGGKIIAIEVPTDEIGHRAAQRLLYRLSDEGANDTEFVNEIIPCMFQG